MQLEPRLRTSCFDGQCNESNRKQGIFLQQLRTLRQNMGTRNRDCQYLSEWDGGDTIGDFFRESFCCWGEIFLLRRGVWVSAADISSCSDSKAIALYWAELLQTNPNATGQDAMNVLVSIIFNYFFDI